ncbi:hemerythrin domain-containing protein [Sphingomonas qomolangmaensis]|uniref:Hemerythrin domain-containing protein n=1 Tax=Sphingomonas qomolangmaensis TaxID=2918765 RepID=A0ABY5LD59_9SPHN|nr:hemerythrin domain-containing protein [Sphingomonas qomolangmaensis]UUL83963.1 hemerythrin domain-containing protein [Sphingomonas qomolangmaensis]
MTTTTTIDRDSEGRTAKPDKPNLGLLAGAATAGAALGMLAMIGRKAAVQAPSALARDWVEALTLEHKAVLKIFDALEATDSRNTTKRAMLLAQMKHALVKHDVEESSVIYPALREAGQVEAADHLTKDHGYVKQHLYDLDNSPKDSPDFLIKVRKFRADIEQHMTEEETELFPALRAQLSEEKNKHLTSAMNKEGFKVA